MGNGKSFEKTGAGTTRYLHGEKKCLPYIQKLTQMDKIPKCKA